MKKHFSKILTAMLLVIMIVMTALPSVSAAALLDSTKKVSLSMNCSKPGYEFTVYQIATLDTNASTPYETKYNSLIADDVSSETITANINDGDTAALLATLDKIDEPMPTSAPVKYTWSTSATTTTATATNLPQGIYYVKATNYPAGVQAVTNSVVALPYYKDNTAGWTYSIANIELATKVVDKDVETKKIITNSTKNNVNFTDVSLGDTVNFEIRSTVTGSKAMKLNSYLVTDEMSQGLTLNKDSFKVSLLKEDGTKVAVNPDLARSTSTTATPNNDYSVSITQDGGGTTGKATNFTVALTPEYLQKNDFYASDVYYTSITYSATLNANAVIGSAGNPNTEGKIEYSNKKNVTMSHPGNTVYVYTYAVTTNKVNPEKQPLENGEFKLFKTEADAQSVANAIATGVSDKNGKVAYLNAAGEEISLTSGTYYVVETKAPAGYNLYGKVIRVDISATYGNSLVNGTYVTNCPKNGTAEFTVTDTRLIAPKTGGYGNTWAYILGGVLLAGGIAVAVVLIAKKKRSKTAC